jgi:Domain of unknown function DUF11
MKRGLLAAATLSCLGVLGVATSAAQEPPTADLAIVSNTANVRHAKVGQEVIFTIVATDYGPDVTEEVHVQTAVALRSISEGPEICGLVNCSTVICDRSLGPGPSADTPDCEFDDVHVGELYTARAAFTVLGTGSKYASETACVTSPEYPPRNDPNPANDCATATVKIIGRHKV